MGEESPKLPAFKRLVVCTESQINRALQLLWNQWKHTWVTTILPSSDENGIQLD